ncbi:hypothetical protein GF378_00005, partial [Candidatus Pacearchaeota archaeon]|nr:hypothetical protein [Candidatus Pacearchaeota archaeon]
MKTMKTIAILMTMLLVFTAMPLVAAENDTVTDVSDVSDVSNATTNTSDIVENITEEDEVDAGVTPDSPFYGLERAMERISLALTANKAERARKSLRYAEERLSEVKEMVEKNKAKAAEKAQKGHDKLVNETENIIDELETDGDEKMAEEAFENIVELKLRAESHSERV